MDDVIEKWLRFAAERFSTINLGATVFDPDDVTRVAEALGYQVFERAGGSWVRFPGGAHREVR